MVVVRRRLAAGSKFSSDGGGQGRKKKKGRFSNGVCGRVKKEGICSACRSTNGARGRQDSTRGERLVEPAVVVGAVQDGEVYCSGEEKRTRYVDRAKAGFPHSKKSLRWAGSLGRSRSVDGMGRPAFWVRLN